MNQILGPGIVMMPALPPRQHLAETFTSTLDKWGTGERHIRDPKRVPGVDKVRTALAACEAALAKLGKRTGARADDARGYLEQHRDACRAALAAFADVGADFDGPTALDLIEKVTAYRAAEGAAKAAINTATRATIKAAREQMDMAEVDGRELNRDIAAVLKSVQFPALADLAAIDRARSETEEITSGGGTAKHKPATTLQRALEQAAAAPKGVARMWICFEPASPSDACTWRWRRYEEG